MFWSSGDGQSWKKQLFGQRFPFWDTNLARKKTHKLQQFKIATKLCKSQIQKKMVRFGKMSVKLCRVGRVW